MEVVVVVIVVVVCVCFLLFSSLLFPFLISFFLLILLLFQVNNEVKMELVRQEKKQYFRNLRMPMLLSRSKSMRNRKR